MDKLKDKLHDCEKCGLFPCSEQDIVSVGEICKDCPTACCRMVLVPLLPCEMTLESGGYFESGGSLKMRDDDGDGNGWCHYYDEKVGCTIYEFRPLACRIASCRFIREGSVPDG